METRKNPNLQKPMNNILVQATCSDCTHVSGEALSNQFNLLRVPWGNAAGETENIVSLCRNWMTEFLPCPACGTQPDSAVKQRTVADLPPVLALHIERLSAYNTKIRTRVCTKPSLQIFFLLPSSCLLFHSGLHSWLQSWMKERYMHGDAPCPLCWTFLWGTENLPVVVNENFPVDAQVPLPHNCHLELNNSVRCFVCM